MNYFLPYLFDKICFIGHKNVQVGSGSIIIGLLDPDTEAKNTAPRIRNRNTAGIYLLSKQFVSHCLGRYGIQCRPSTKLQSLHLHTRQH
jgi:hypothetical protein